MDVNDANSNIPDYFRSNSNISTAKRAHKVSMNKIQNKYSEIIQELNILKAHHSVQVKDDIQTYQAFPRRVAYVLQEPE